MLHKTLNHLLAEKSLFIFFLLSFIFVSLHFHPFDHLASYDQKRALQSLFFGLIVISTIAIRNWRKAFLSACSLPAHSTFILLLACTVLGAASSLLSLSPYYALLDIALYISLFFITISASITTRHNQPVILNTVIPFLAICLLIYFFQVLVGYLMITIGVITLPARELIINFSNERLFNQFQSWYLPLLLAPLLYSGTKSPLRWAIFSAASGSWTLIFVSGARGTTVGLLVGCTIALLIYRRQAYTWLMKMIQTMVVGLVIYLLLFKVAHLLTSTSIHSYQLLRHADSENERLIMWSEGVKQIIDAPLLGIGPAHFPCYSSLPYSSPHSTVIQLGMEWGLPVLCITVALFFVGSMCWVKGSLIRCSKPGNTNLEIPLFASFITASTHSLVSGIIVTPLSQFIGAAIIGWMIGIHYRDHPTKKHTHLRGYIVLILATITLAFIGSEVFSYLQLNDELRYLESSGGGPRFWIHGNICPE